MCVRWISLWTTVVSWVKQTTSSGYSIQTHKKNYPSKDAVRLVEHVFLPKTSCSAPIRRVIYPQRLNGESYLAGLIKLFSQMTREVVRSPGPGIRARSTAIFCLQPEQHSLLDAADAKIDEAAYAAAATPSRTGHPSTTTACRPQA